MSRIVWQASPANAASAKAAQRLGFQNEGVSRWNPFVKRNGKRK